MIAKNIQLCITSLNKVLTENILKKKTGKWDTAWNYDNNLNANGANANDKVNN